MARIANEAEAMQAEVQPKMEALHGKCRAAIRKGDLEAGLRYYEAYVRLSLAPAFHVWRSMPPDHPQREAELAKLDQTVAEQVRAIAQQLGVAYEREAD